MTENVITFWMNYIFSQPSILNELREIEREYIREFIANLLSHYRYINAVVWCSVKQSGQIIVVFG